MLSRRMARCLQACLKATFSSASSDVAHADAHGDYKVHIDKNATWIKYRSDPKLMPLTGLQQTHVKMLDREDSNPWEHIQNYGFFTYERMYFYNPWYHSEEHDPLVESGEKGYISGEDPFDTRHNAGYSEMASFSLAVVGIVLYAMSYTEHSADVEMYLQRSTLEYVQEELKKKNKLLNELKAREAELLANK